jgi:Spy/CpxP family protein refolding chaperone
MNVNLLERPVAGRSWDPRIVCSLALALMFLTGGAVGALVMDLVVHNRQKPPVYSSPNGQALYFQKLQKELDLTPDQSQQIESLLNDFWQYYRGVLGDSKSKLEQLLTPEQRVKFERMLAAEQQKR